MSQTAGTLASTADVMRLAQNYAANSGAALDVTSATTNSGLIARFNDDGTFTDSTPVVIDQSGQVGIGTTAPSSPLTIKATSATSTGGIRLISSSNSNVIASIQDSGAGDIGFLALNTGGTNKVVLNAGGDSYINTSGNVGIGDTTPASLLTVGNGDLFQVNSSGDITTATNENLGITAAGTGDINVVTDADTFLNLAGLTASAGTSLCVDGSNNVVTCTAGSSAATLQSAYNAGNTITTTDARNIDITLADTATDQTVRITQAGTANALFVGDDGTFTDSTPFVIDASGNVGIGTASPTSPLQIVASTTSTSNGSSLANTYTITPGSASTATYKGQNNLALSNSANTSGATVVGVFGEARAANTGNVGTAIGGQFIVTSLDLGGGAATVANGYGIQVQAASNIGSTFTKNAGIAIADQTAATNNTNLLIGTTTIPTGNFSIYNSSTANNYFAGNVGIGDTTPAALLTVGNGDLFQVSSAGALTFNGVATDISTGTNEDLKVAPNGSGNVTIGTSDTTGTLLVLDTKTDAADPTGSNGGMYYNSNSGKFRCFQGGAWTDCIGSGSGTTTLQQAYDNDADGSDSVIALTANDDSLIFRNPASAGSDSEYVLTLDQLNTGAKGGLFINDLGSSSSFALRIDDSSSDTTPFVVQSDGDVVIGGTNDGSAILHVAANPVDASAAAGFLVDGTLTSSTNDQYGARIDNNITPGAASTQTYRGLGLSPTVTNNNLSGGIAIGVNSFVGFSAGGTLGTAVAGRFYLNNTSTGTISNGYGIQISDAVNASGTITKLAGISISNQTAGTNNTNLLIGTNTIPSGDFSIYNSSANNNYFAGNLGLGDTTPAALLTVGNGDLFQVNSSGDITTASNENLGITAAGTGDINVVTDADTFLNLAGLTASAGTSLCVDGSNNVVTCTAGSSAATLQSAYNAGNTITTTDARNIDITLADTATDQTVRITQAGTANALFVGDDGTFTDSTPFVIDASGNVGMGTGTPGSPLDLKSTNTTGTLFGIGAPSAVSLTGTLTGQSIDLSTNYTFTNQSATGQSISLAGTTNTNTSGTNTYKGINISGGATIQNGAGGTLNWIGLDIATPAQTQTAGTLINTGLRVNGGVVTSGTLRLVELLSNGTQRWVIDQNGALTQTNVSSSGTAYSMTANSLTSGTGLAISSTATAMTSGKLLTLSKTGASGSTAFTGDIANIAYSQTFNGGVGLDSTGNVVDISRSITLNNAGNTHTISGALATFSDSGTQTAGTLASTADVMRLAQNYTANSGAALNVTSATTNSGLVARFNDDGTFTDSTPVVIDQAGNVGIGDATPASLLTVGNGDLFQVDSSGDITTASGENLGITAGGTGDIVITTDADTTLQLAGLSGAAGTSLCIDGSNNVVTCSTGSSAATLQSAYNNGNTITTTDGRNISITLADTTTDQTVEITQAGTANAFQVNDDGTFSDSTPFIIDATGNVGIGTTSAGDLLTVKGGDIVLREDDNGNQAVTLAADNNGGVIRGFNAGVKNFEFDARTNGNSYFNSGGNVGIGDTTPASLLTVGNGDLFQVNSSGDITTASNENLGITAAGTGDINVVTDADTFLNLAGLTASAGTSLCVDGSNNVVTCTAGSSAATLQSAYNAGNTITTTDGRNISITLADTTTDQTFEITQAGTANAFRVNDDGTFTDSTPFVIDSGGLVGIGTASPSAALQVSTNVSGSSGNPTGLLVNSSVTGTGVAAYGANITSTVASDTANSAILRVSGVFDPTAAVSTLTSSANSVTVGGSSANAITNLLGYNMNATKGGSYTGTISNLNAFQAGDPSGFSAGQVTNFTGFNASAITNGNGLASATTTTNTGFNVGAFSAGANTAGTINNRGINIAQFTGSSATGGTVNNESVRINVPNGDGTNGTTNNYGLRITGNTSAGDLNYAIYNDSTNNNYIAGNLGLGDTTPAALLTVGNGDLFQVNSSGDITTATNENLGITAAGTGDINVVTDSDSFLNLAGLTSAAGTSLCVDGSNNVVTCSGGSSSASLQSAYNTGNTITTTNARNISITLADTATDQTFEITQAGTADAFRVNDDGTFSDTSPFVIDASGNVGVGVAAPGAVLDVSPSATVSNSLLKVSGTTTGLTGVSFNPTVTSSTTGQIGVDLRAVMSPTGAVGTVYGSTSTQTLTGASNVTTAFVGFNSNIITDASRSGTIASAETIRAATPTFTGSKPTTQTGVRIQNQGISGVTDAYGLYVEAQGGATNNYAGIFAGGNVGIGDTTPAGLFTVGNGDLFQVSSAGQAKFNGVTADITTGTNEDLNLAPNGTGNVTTGTSDTTGTLFVLDTKTSAGDPTGVNGGMYYNSNAGKFRCYQAGAWADCVGGGSGSTTLQQAYDNDADGSNAVITLTSTDGGVIIKDAASTVGTLFAIQNNGGTANFFQVTATGATMQDSSGNSAFVLDSSTSHLKVYENISSPVNFADIYYDNATSSAIFTASSGTTQIGSGSGGGNINLILTGTSDQILASKTNTLSASYSLSDFKYTRNLTAGTNAVTGNVFTVEDLTTFSSGSSAPNVLYVNQNNTSATGNLILAQTGGGSNDKFAVNTAGTVTIASGQTYKGAGSLTLQSGAASALTVDSGTTGDLNIGTGANAKNITIGNATGATSTTIQAGTGDLTLKPITSDTTAFKLQDSGGQNFLVLDTTNDRLQVGDPTGDTTGVVLVLDTKTDSGDPTGVNGAMYYNSNTNTFRCYENGAWADCLSRHTIVLGSDFTSAASTSYQDVTAFSFSVTSGVTYRFSALIDYVTAGTAAGAKWSVNGPASPTLLGFAEHNTITATTDNSNQCAAYDCGAASASSLAAGNTAILQGIIKPSANGTLIIRVGGEVASTVTAKAGSVFEWW